MSSDLAAQLANVRAEAVAPGALLLAFIDSRLTEQHTDTSKAL
jgi:hypothetical protein